MAKQLRADHVGQHRTAYEKNRSKLIKLARQGGALCGICGKEIDPSHTDPLDPLAIVIDHIVPISKGGHPSDISNLQLAHRWCNRQKSDKLFDVRSRFKEEEQVYRNDVLPLHADWTAYRP